MLLSRFASRKESLRRRRAIRRRTRTIEALESRRVLATYFVDTTVDTDTGTCAADNAAGNSGCSIRSAILAAEANPGPDTIEIPDGTYVPSGFGSFDLEVSDDIRFVGNLADPSAVVIDGNNQFRLFDIFGDGSDFRVSFEGMTLQNGRARDGSGGAAINSFRTVDLSINKVIIQNNLADFNTLDPFFSPPSSGGGIDASGNVTIRDSIIRDNTATRNGGGIDFSANDGVDKSLVIIDSTISGNFAGDPAIDLGVGGGLYARGANATVVLRNVDVLNNSAGDSGGGVYTSSVEATVFDSTFTGNSALGSDSGGGGLYILGPGEDFSVFDSSFTSNTAVAGAGGFEAVDNSGSIESTTFSLNRVTGVGTDFDQGGGAIAIISQSNQNVPSVALTDLTVTENEAPSAGGIAVVEALVSIRNSNISANQATGASIGSAGGIGAIATSTLGGLTIEGSTIASNTAVLQAGGVGAIDMNIDLSNTVIEGNIAQNGRAGGVGLGSQGIGIQPLLLASGVTISNNRSQGDGGGIGVDGGDLSLSNATVSGNRSLTGNGGGIALVNANPIVGPVISYSTIASNQAVAGSNIAIQNSDITLAGSLFADGTGVAVGGSFLSIGSNLDQSGTLGLAGPGDLSGVDPLIGPLQDNGGRVPTHALLSGSPAIDAGPGDGPSSDARGAVRPLDGDGIGGPAFDIGAFELDQAITVVVDNTSDIDDGDLSAGNLSLREAVRLVNDNGAVATSTINFDPTVFGVPRTITLGGSSLNLFRSVDIVGPGQDLLTISANDSSLVFQIGGATGEEERSLQGMTLTNGRSGPFILLGGAIWATAGSLTIDEVTIRDSFAGSGGALSNRSISGSGVGATVVIRNSTITGNRAFDAAGIDNAGNMTIIDSTISNNQTYTSMYGPSGSGYGGGIRNSGTLTIMQSLITGNTANEDGAGIENSGELALIESVLSGNTAGSFGGGIAAFSGTANIIRSSIANNTAGDSGGGVFNSGARISILDSTVSGNQATDNGGGIFNYGGGSISLTNSTIGGNQASRSGGGIFNGELSSGSSTGTNSLVITNSSIVDNLADADDADGDSGGGIFTVNEAISTTTLFNAIVAGNRVGLSTPVVNEISGKDLASASAFNLVSDPQSAGGLSDGVLGNIVGDGGGVLPLAQILDSNLTDNGGPTQTYALVTGSPAIDAGDSTRATTPGADGIPGTGDDAEEPLDDDQRGAGFSRVLGASVDIGAFEAPASATPRVSITDVLVNEGQGTATIVARLEDPAADNFSLQYTTNNGSAVSPEDFVGGTGTLDFDGSQFQEVSFEIPITDDAVAEPRESFFISLSVLSSVEPIDVSDVGVVSIEDDDEAVLLIQDVSISESGGPLTVDVVLQGDSDAGFTVDLLTDDSLGEAVSGVDFLSNFTRLSFSGFDGEIQTFTVDIIDDAIVEGDEQFEIIADRIVTNGSNVRFQSLSGPLELVPIDQFATPSTFSQAVDLDAAGNTAYLADSGGLLVIDVSDPFNIALLGSYTNPLGSPYDVKVVGNLAYLLGDGLEVLDISDPANITRLDQYTQGGLFISSLDVQGSNVYLGLSDSFGVDGGLAIVDASDPANLSLLGDISLGQVSDVEVNGNVAYLAQPFGGLVTLDVTDPAAIAQLGRADAGEALTLSVQDNIAYVGTASGLSVWDVTNPTNLGPLGNYATEDDVLSVEFDIADPFGPVVYLGTAGFSPGSNGLLEVLDVSDPTNIQRLGQSNDVGQPFGVTSDSVFVYAADGAQGLRVLLRDSIHVSTATIVNDDTATLTVSDVTVNETSGSATVTVTLDNEVQGGFSYEFTTNDGSAIAGVDYTTTTGSFSSGSAGAQQSIDIPILADAVPEPDKTFTVSLFNVTPFGSVDPLSIDATDVGVVTITEAAGDVDLAITKADDIDPVQPDDVLNYTLVVTNNGTATATGVTVTDSLPMGLSFEFGTVDGDGSRISEDQGLVTANVGDLAAGQSATILIQVIVESTAMNPLENTATVSSNEIDIDPTNNSTTELTAFDFFLATDDVFVVEADSAGNFLNVLDNDLPGLDGPITVTQLNLSSTIGAVAIASGGSGVVYTPPVGFSGQDRFVYTIQNATGREALATVFINVSPAGGQPSIFGHVYCDENGSGAEDSGEESVGVRVFLDLDGDRIFDAGERSTLTDTNGDYRFDNVTESAVTVVAEVPDGCNTIPFKPGVVRSTIGVGDLARSIAHVDVDDDGDLDLLVASDLSNSLAVLVNEGGNFTLQREIPLGDRPQSVTAWLDDASSTPLVAVAAVGPTLGEGSLFVFELGGPIVPIAFEAGNGPIDVVIDDFNLNGQPDVLVGTLRSSEVLLFLDGEVEPEVVAVARQVRTVTTGDVNNDGIPDIVVGGYGYDEDPASELSVHLGDGTGGFGEPIVAEISQKLIATQVGKLSSDPTNTDDTRVMALSASGEFKVFALDGDVLTEVEVLEVKSGSNAFGLGDFNRDGLTDLAISSQSKQAIDVFVGVGDGGFIPILSLDQVAAPSDLVVGDLDNDGQADDLAVSNLYQDARAGLPGPSDFFLPSATTILRLDVSEFPVVISDTATRVDFVFESADPEIRSRMDVSGDGLVTALDALQVINALPGAVGEGESALARARSSTDVNGDGRTSAVDALMIINFLGDPSESQISINLLTDDEDEADRVAAVDVILRGQLF